MIPVAPLLAVLFLLASFYCLCLCTDNVSRAKAKNRKTKTKPNNNRFSSSMFNSNAYFGRAKENRDSGVASVNNFTPINNPGRVAPARRAVASSVPDDVKIFHVGSAELGQVPPPAELAVGSLESFPSFKIDGKLSVSLEEKPTPMDDDTLHDGGGGMVPVASVIRSRPGSTEIRKSHNNSLVTGSGSSILTHISADKGRTPFEAYHEDDVTPLGDVEQQQQLHHHSEILSTLMTPPSSVLYSRADSLPEDKDMNKSVTMLQSGMKNGELPGPRKPSFRRAKSVVSLKPVPEDMSVRHGK